MSRCDAAKAAAAAAADSRQPQVFPKPPLASPQPSVKPLINPPFAPGNERQSTIPCVNFAGDQVVR